MPTESAATMVDRWVKAWNDADLDAVDELFAADYTVNGELGACRRE